MLDSHTARLLADLDIIDDVHPAGLVQRLCDRVPVAVAVSGASASVISDGATGVVAVSNETAQRLEDLQLTLNEGPGLDAYSEHGPVVVPDLQHSTRWATYPADAIAAGARAVFGFPLQLGAIKIGALTLYRAEPGPLSAIQLNRVFDVAEVMIHMLLIAGSGSDADGLSLLWADLDEDWTVVHQATGMVSVQLGCGVDDALIRLRAHAFVTGRRFVEVARDVVARQLRLEHDQSLESE